MVFWFGLNSQLTHWVHTYVRNQHVNSFKLPWRNQKIWIFEWNKRGVTWVAPFFLFSPVPPIKTGLAAFCRSMMRWTKQDKTIVIVIVLTDKTIAIALPVLSGGHEWQKWLHFSFAMEALSNNCHGSALQPLFFSVPLLPASLKFAH